MWINKKRTAERIYIKNIYDLIKNVKTGLADHKSFYKDVELAQQRYYDNLNRLEER